MRLSCFELNETAYHGQQEQRSILSARSVMAKPVSSPSPSYGRRTSDSRALPNSGYHHETDQAYPGHDSQAASFGRCGHEAKSCTLPSLTPSTVVHSQ
jgi:hypothetical protein